MKRKIIITAALGFVALVPVNAQADTASPTPVATGVLSASPTPHPTKTGNSAARLLARQAAHTALNAALLQAQNGRDLAFADADATLMQSLQSAGKDQGAKHAARAVYKLAATSIITAFKQAVILATQNFKAALAAIK